MQVISCYNHLVLSDSFTCPPKWSGMIPRTMLGVPKIIQYTSKSMWKYDSLQNFTTASDIDWSKRILYIASQLYTKCACQNMN